MGRPISTHCAVCGQPFGGDVVKVENRGLCLRCRREQGRDASTKHREKIAREDPPPAPAPVEIDTSSPFGPSYGFAQMGSYYGANVPGFWQRMKKMKAAVGETI